jgi:hypothetical protein
LVLLLVPLVLPVLLLVLLMLLLINLLVSLLLMRRGRGWGKCRRSRESRRKWSNQASACGGRSHGSAARGEWREQHEMSSRLNKKRTITTTIHSPVETINKINSMSSSSSSTYNINSRSSNSRRSSSSCTNNIYSTSSSCSGRFRRSGSGPRREWSEAVAQKRRWRRCVMLG